MATPTKTVRIKRLLTTTSLSIAKVAVKLKTHPRFVREVADRYDLPTNRTIVPGAPLALRLQGVLDRSRPRSKRTFNRVAAAFRLSPAALRAALK